MNMDARDTKTVGGPADETSGSEEVRPTFLVGSILGGVSG